MALNVSDRLFKIGVSGLAVLFHLGCVDQHNPVPDWEKQVEESRVANRPVVVLAADGTLPVISAASADAKSPVDLKYDQFCSSCHGAAGAGDGPGAAALNPPPRNFKDKAWQAQVDDTRIYNVIKDGGLSQGLAATMGPWGAVLSEEELKAMVQKIRAYGQ